IIRISSILSYLFYFYLDYFVLLFLFFLVDFIFFIILFYFLFYILYFIYVISSKHGKGAKLSAKRREAFLKMIADSDITQLDTEQAAAHPVKATRSKSIPPPRTSDG